MYTSQKSIENKVGSVNGWKELLMSVGFRFEPAANGIPSAVFFPQSDPGERLTQCSASLQAILGLAPSSWAALSSLLASPDSADEVMAMIRQVIGQFGPRDLEFESVKTPVSVMIMMMMMIMTMMIIMMIMMTGECEAVAGGWVPRAPRQPRV